MTATSKLSERVVLVTGSSSGIGRAIAVAFGQEEARVAITYHSNREGAEETGNLVREAGGEALVVHYDMTDYDSIDAAVQAVTDRWKTIDVLVNNAIPTDVGPIPFEALSLLEWQRIVHGIEDGVFRTIQAALPAMRESDSGRIVNISSSAVEGSSGMAAYATAKAGVHSLTKVLATELGERRILLNVVMPGMVLTETNRQRPEEVLKEVAERTPSGHITTPEDVANLVVFLGSEANGNVNGAVVPVTGGL